jgi:hypothetical protein
LKRKASAAGLGISPGPVCISIRISSSSYNNHFL